VNQVPTVDPTTVDPTTVLPTTVDPTTVLPTTVLPTTLLPTTMVGSYPRPAWFHQQLAGRDILDAFKQWKHAEAYVDAVRVVVADQADAGLDVVTDGNMWYDDYTMGIGAFFWHTFERVEGFGPEKLAHPARARAQGLDGFIMDECGAAALRGDIGASRMRLGLLYEIAQQVSARPVKASVGAGAAQLSSLVRFESGPIHDRYALAAALADVFRAEIDDLVAAGCQHIQYEDLGAWLPNLTGEKDFDWVIDTVNRVIGGVGVHTSWHFCFGNAWGNRLVGLTAGGYRRIVPHYFDVDVDELVLDFACREMEDIEVLRDLPAAKRVAVGVIDVRTLEIEAPEQVAARARQALAFVPPDRLTLTTDCGMKQLPRQVAAAKLRALVAGAEIVRREVA
jgi:5-methyltetrahydropteroyltriglutamate--homocysteine methyltransferase